MGPKMPPKKVLKNWGVSRLQSVFRYFSLTKIKGVKRAFKRQGEIHNKPREAQEMPGEA